MTPDEIAARYPFYDLDGIVLGSINRKDEGYWDGATVFDWWRRQARERGVEYVANEVVTMTRDSAGTRVESVTLASGELIACGHVVNASGPRAARTAAMAGIHIPVEPRKRYSWVFKAERPLDRELPLTIDPSGVHVREFGGGTYLCGGHALGGQGFGQAAPGVVQPGIDCTFRTIEHSCDLHRRQAGGEEGEPDAEAEGAEEECGVQRVPAREQDRYGQGDHPMGIQVLTPRRPSCPFPG